MGYYHPHPPSLFIIITQPKTLGTFYCPMEVRKLSQPRHCTPGVQSVLNQMSLVGWLVGWGLTALLTQNRSYRACRFVGIFYSKL